MGVGKWQQECIVWNGSGVQHMQASRPDNCCQDVSTSHPGPNHKRTPHSTQRNQDTHLNAHKVELVVKDVFLNGLEQCCHVGFALVVWQQCHVGVTCRHAR